MKKILIIYPNCSKESAYKLKESLDKMKGIYCNIFNPFEAKARFFMAWDLVINYGCNRDFAAIRVLNTTKGVSQCIDKLKTFKILTANKIPTMRS
ncbi:MAG TPA: hypothetical protein VFM18_21825 [Methanosarcina sp.]|nr:hypothetical protein [Methanosarcina sp.]